MKKLAFALALIAIVVLSGLGIYLILDQDTADSMKTVQDSNLPPIKNVNQEIDNQQIIKEKVAVGLEQDLKEIEEIDQELSALMAEMDELLAFADEMDLENDFKELDFN